MNSGDGTARRGRVTLLAAGLLLMTAMAHLPALRGDFIWDDDRYVTGNELLGDSAGLRRIWLEPGSFPQYYPLVLTSFWLERRAWGLQPLGYHATNVALHAANAVLAWLLLRTLAAPGAWFAAAIFALHPVHVESVAWVTERKNLLSGFFALLSLLAYVAGDFRAGKRGGGRPSAALYCLALAAFALALLSKTTAASVPAVLLVLLWWRRGSIAPRDALPLVPFFAAGIVMGLLTVHMEKTYVRAVGPEWALTFLERVLVAGRALWFYVGKLLWPVRLTFSYPRWEINAGAWWQHLYPLAALASVLALWRLRRRLGRGPLAAALIFGGTLVPALGFFDTFPMRYSFVADHFQYLSSLAVIALVSYRAALVSGGTSSGATAAPWKTTAALVLLLLGALTWRQGGIYRDAETLWRDTIRKNPWSWMAHTNLGALLLEEGRHGEAARAFERSLEIRPDSPNALAGLGRVAAARGDLDAAARLLDRALALSPESAAIRLALANTLARRGDAAAARSHYLELLRIGHSPAKVAGNLGTLAAERGDWAEALHFFEVALEVEPASASRQLAAALARGRLAGTAASLPGCREAGRIDRAETVRQLLRILAAAPGDPIAAACLAEARPMGAVP